MDRLSSQFLGRIYPYIHGTVFHDQSSKLHTGTVVYGMNKNVETTVSVKKESGKIFIHVEAAEPCKVVLVDEHVENTEGAAMEKFIVEGCKTGNNEFFC